MVGWVWCQPCPGVVSPKLRVPKALRPAPLGLPRLGPSGSAPNPTCPLVPGVRTGLGEKHSLSPPQSDVKVNFNSITWAFRCPRTGHAGLGVPGWLGSPVLGCVLCDYHSFSFHRFPFPFVPRSSQPSPPLFSSPLSRVSDSPPAQVCGERG